jgi:hypothetical protein
MGAARARRVDQVRVTQLLLAPSVAVLLQRTVVLARDGLAGDWAAIVDRHGAVLAATADTVAFRRPSLLAAIAWGRADADGDHVIATTLADQDVALVVGRRAAAFAPTARDRLGVLAGMATVVWGHLDAGPADGVVAGGGQALLLRTSPRKPTAS